MMATAFGIVTSVLTAVLLAVVQRQFGIAIYSFMVVFIPFGAIFSGLCAASGYYFGARLFQRRPTRVLIFNVMSVAVMTYFLINYLNYSLLEIHGQPVAKLISFSRYLDFVLRHQRMEFASPGISRTTGELGVFGYALAAFEVLGFAAGGLLAYGHVSSAPYCQVCKRYLPKQSTTKRYTGDRNQLLAVYSRLLAYLQRGDTSEAKTCLCGFGSVTGHAKKKKLNVELKLWKCITCPEEFVELNVKQIAEGRVLTMLVGLMPPFETVTPWGWKPRCDLEGGWQVRQYLQRKS
jgi:hypothetical protein